MTHPAALISTTALEVALAFSGDGAPAWVQLMPRGPELVAVDGRRWRLIDPAAVVASARLPLALDFEHAMDDAKTPAETRVASGWVEALEVRDGAIWGRVAWTSRAAAALAAREWRFFSPSFLHTAEGDVRQIIGGGLVNRPAFRQLPALAHVTPQETFMIKSICAALGLPDTASGAEAVVAIGKLRDDARLALVAAQTPALEKFAPRAELEAALARATTAEAQIATQARASHEAAVAAAIEGAVKAGKIAPAGTDYYRATCATAAGLAGFKKFVESQPSIFAGSGLDRRDPAAPGDKVALTSEQQSVARAMGLDASAFAKHLAAQAA